MFTQARSHSGVHHVRNPLVIPHLSGSTQMFTQARSHTAVHHVRNPLVIPQLSGSTQELIKGKTRQLYSVKKILCEFRPPNVSLCGQSFSNLSAFSQHSKVIQERNLTSFLIKVVYYFRQFNTQKNSYRGDIFQLFIV